MKSHSKKKKSKLTTKTIFMLSVGVLLLFGLVSALVLSKKEQDISSRANVDTAITLSASASQVNVGDNFQIYAEILSQEDLVQSVDLVLSFAPDLANFVSAEPGDFFASADEIREETRDVDGDERDDIVYVLFLPVGASLPPCPATITDPTVCVTSHGSRLATLNFTATNPGLIEFADIRVTVGASGQTVNVLSNFTGTNVTVAGEPTATSTPVPTITGEPTATSTPVPTITGEPTATSTPVPTTTGEPTATPTPGSCEQLTADFNDDCKVGSYDYQYMKDRYSRTDADGLTADIGGEDLSQTPDGQVDIWDYSILTSQWTGD